MHSIIRWTRSWTPCSRSKDIWASNHVPSSCYCCPLLQPRVIVPNHGEVTNANVSIRINYSTFCEAMDPWHWLFPRVRFTFVLPLLVYGSSLEHFVLIYFLFQTSWPQTVCLGAVYPPKHGSGPSSSSEWVCQPDYAIYDSPLWWTQTCLCRYVLMTCSNVNYSAPNCHYSYIYVSLQPKHKRERKKRKMKKNLILKMASLMYFSISFILKITSTWL